jgi:glycosyltransferase involved in cell wall biosynthesis
LGVIKRHKGVHVLIQAFRRIKNPKCRLKIYGNFHDQEADYAMEVMCLAHKDSRISFQGPYFTSEEKDRALRQIDVLCFPSIWNETYGMVVDEAFSAGIPIIASRVGAIPERVQDNTNGFTVAPHDIEGFYEAMNQIVKNPSLINQLRKNIVSLRSSEKEALQYEKIYRNSFHETREEDAVRAV